MSDDVADAKRLDISGEEDAAHPATREGVAEDTPVDQLAGVPRVDAGRNAACRTGGGWWGGGGMEGGEEQWLCLGGFAGRRYGRWNPKPKAPKPKSETSSTETYFPRHE